MLGLPALEVTLQLARSLKRDPDTHVQAWAELRQVLIESLLGKAWLVDLEKPRLNAEATAAAELDAAGATTLSEEPFPRATTAYAPAIMTDYVLSIGRDRVNVRTLPFGIAVKVTLVGDVAIDPKLVSLIKYHGGRWRQKYRNWLCPLAEQRGLYFGRSKLKSTAYDIGAFWPHTTLSTMPNWIRSLSRRRFSHTSWTPSFLRAQSRLRNLCQISVVRRASTNEFAPESPQIRQSERASYSTRQ